MLRAAVKNLIYSCGVILGVVVLLTVLFFSFLSGDEKAALEMTGQQTNREILQRIREEYALDQPVALQVLYYINDISPLSIHRTDRQSHITYPASHKYRTWITIPAGNHSVLLKQPYLRRSYQSNRPVMALIGAALPSTLLLAFTAIIFATCIGMVAGTVAALYRDSWIDRTILTVTSLGVSLPSFFVAVLVSWLLGYVLHRFTGLPTWGSLYEMDDYTGEKHLRLSHLVLPAFTLGIRPLAVITQMTRNSMLDALRSDYIRTARAKGLRPGTVIYKHALRNAVNTVITTISGWLGGMLAGAVFVEYIFGWKGLGKMIVDSLSTLDYPVVIGATVTISFMYVLLNFAVDILYMVADPRLRKKY